MSVEKSRIFLLHTESGAETEGELWDKITDQQLHDWESQWVPALAFGVQRLQKARTHNSKWPPSSTWDWREKIAAVRDATFSHSSFCVMCDGQTQGLIILDSSGRPERRCRIENQRSKDLLYVELVEVAPWNRKEFHQTPRYRGVGGLLIAAAIQKSQEEGFKGRLGLHSLPLANSFYANKCGMHDLGGDSDNDGLRYFEMTPGQASAFLAKGNKS
ncbi:MAG: family N-acetyltransferase [Rhodocyclales bacterium]|nr:family N-acetyltransferase [Rhodocyclales bacterium]